MVNTFPKGICPKVNIIAQLEYELAYYDSAVHRFNNYTTLTPHWDFEVKTNHLIPARLSNNKQKSKKKKKKERKKRPAEYGLCCPSVPQSENQRKRKER